MSASLVREHLQRQQEALKAELAREERKERKRDAREAAREAGGDETASKRRKRRRPVQSEEARELAEAFATERATKEFRAKKLAKKDRTLSKKQRRQLAQEAFTKEYEDFVTAETRDYETLNKRLDSASKKLTLKTNAQASKLLKRLAKRDQPSHRRLTEKARRRRKPFTLYGDGAREQE
ncbi:Hypothetical Protein FCC1311_055632 [Hondaea fermentalgiana]|uniref:Uncharacterized protein n=1 Tax=Hondaea fermentalgiana TaxID=2315210 RepID=A0A2R5GM22_9STRA|nr:Hypothetical Protein FCC1311_055632 [Hondaea fermentalgiana]|eukprot:GBG29341.1 Hypothetical Protein FCC1311_055632 [Hondaea fermentalgiana]